MRTCHRHSELKKNHIKSGLQPFNSSMVKNNVELSEEMRTNNINPLIQSSEDASQPACVAFEQSLKGAY